MDAVTNPLVEVGIDTGGTFTDVVCFQDGRPVGVTKVPSTPLDPSIAILEAVAHLQREWGIAPSDIERFAHGTTVATNALIERKGGCVGLLATEGFSDVIEIGRQMRRQLYEVTLMAETPVFLAPGRRRKGVIERIASDGSVLIPLDENSVRAAARELVDEGVDSIAISFLFSFLHPAHETRARDIIAAEFPELKVSISSEVDPTFREYERTVVTAFDAYVKPVVDSYLGRLRNALKAAGVANEPKIMQSRGGMSAVSVARQRPVRLFLSGPAAGVVGAAEVGKSVGVDDLISLDIGGTSSDIALISGRRPTLRSEGEIEGYPVRVNMVDVNTIGAGGGSLARLDAAGGLRVGPESAGAVPGPACYGRGGDRATVTDASVVLGYLNPEFFAGGSVDLDPALAFEVIKRSIAEPLGFSTERAAQGIHRVVNAQMAEAVRLTSTQRGYDPRRFALVALGGAGPIHATALADELGITKIIVPGNPGVLSALGLLMAPIEHESTMSFQRDLAELSPSVVEAMVAELDVKCHDLMEAEGVSTANTEIRHFADVCYIGQSHHLEVSLHLDGEAPLDRLYQDFKTVHDRIHGHATDAPLKIVNLRSVHSLGRDEELCVDPGVTSRQTSLKSHRSVLFVDADEPLQAAVHAREHLAPGARIDGPAIIEQPDTTTIISTGWQAVVHTSLDLIVEKVTVD
jgi:N-methylhydantoinase A